MLESPAHHVFAHISRVQCGISPFRLRRHIHWQLRRTHWVRLPAIMIWGACVLPDKRSSPHTPSHCEQDMST